MRPLLRLVGLCLAFALVAAGALLLRSLPSAAAPARPDGRCSVEGAIAPTDGVTDATGTSGQPAAGVELRGELVIFAASSLQEAFTDVGAEFERENPGLRVSYNFAGSSVLRAQLANGARADAFAAADEANVGLALRDGTIAGPPIIFARNRLAIIAPRSQSVPLASPRDLARPGLKLVVARADVPAGHYARQALAQMSADPAFGADFADRTLANVVSEESNVRQVVAKVALGEADAGIVYASDLTPATRARVVAIPFPEAASVAIRYPVARAKGGPCAAGAGPFISFLLSPGGQSILARHGFLPAAD